MIRVKGFGGTFRPDWENNVNEHIAKMEKEGWRVQKIDNHMTTAGEPEDRYTYFYSQVVYERDTEENDFGKL